MRKAKLLLRRTWNFLVHDDSWASFLADAVIVILIGKFVFFPFLGLLFGTSFPAVAVVSSSMDHHGQDFENWWANKAGFYESINISKEQFERFYLKNGFKQGDVLVIKGKYWDELTVGDVIIYSVAGKSDPIIHRVISKNNFFLETRGDANSGQLGFEKNITAKQIHGKAVLRIPKIGWVKVGFLKLLGRL